MFFKKDKSASMSLPESKTVHGVIIQKAPVGKYIRALKKAEELPEIICEKCFPGQSVDDIMKMLMSADKNIVFRIAGKLITTAPELIIDMLCEIMELDGDTVMNTFTPKELLDIGIAFWELNDLSDFFGRAWAILKARLSALNSGFKNG